MNIEPGPKSSPAYTPQSELPTSQSIGKSQRTGIQALFGQLKSGVSGLPGRLRGHFPSLLKGHRGSYQLLKPAPGNAHTIKMPKPETAKEKIQLAVDAELAAYPYHRSLDKVNNTASKETDEKKIPGMGSWDLAKPLALAAGNATGLSTKGAEGFIYDKKSGLTAYVFQNPKAVPPEVRIVFGGTTSGKSAGGMEKRSLLNGRFTLNQWIANAKNAVRGKVPDSFQQARELTTQVQRMMLLDKKYADCKLVVSGHSKGGAEASFAALTQKAPLEAVCFSSAELGRDARALIPDEYKENESILKKVRHYKIKGDPIPNVGLLNRKLGHVGGVTTLPAKNILQSPMDRHDKFTRQVHAFSDTSS